MAKVIKDDKVGVNIMKIAIGSDRCGFEYKTRLIEYLTKNGYEVIDEGTYKEEPCDSPYYAMKVGKLVASGECEFGVLICATGTGMAVAANKIKGVMCAVGYGDEQTRKAREHNNCNVIAFGQDHMGYADVERRTKIFLDEKFSGLQHQQGRIDMIRDLEDDKKVELQKIHNENWRSSLN